MKSPHKVKSQKTRILRYVGMLADAAGIVMALRDKPTALDWVAAGTRVAALGVKLRAEVTSGSRDTPWRAFLSDEWRYLPGAMDKYAVQHARDVEVVADHSQADDEGPIRCRGYLGPARHVVEWIEDGEGRIDAGPVVHARHFGAVLDALRELVWAEYSSPQLDFDGSRFSEHAVDETVPLSREFQGLRERVGLFLEHDIPRSVLLEGRPGTGKSSGIAALVHALGLGAVHIDLSTFRRRYADDDRAAMTIARVVQCLRPEVLVLDDLDRIGRDPDLLRLLEVAQMRCKLVLASVNDIDKLDPALRRPGRFDEVVRIERLDHEALSRMVGDELLARRMQDWPAAYVSEWAKRAKVLGRERALEEFEDLEARIERVGDALAEPEREREDEEGELSPASSA